MDWLEREQLAREQIVTIGLRMYQWGFAAGSDGNLSIRLRDNHILMTPSGFSKGFLHPDQIVVIDIDGDLQPTDDPTRRLLRPSTERYMHLMAYRQRDDVQAVIHAHPPLGIACTLAGIRLDTHALPEVMYHLGGIPTARYATPGTPEGAEVVRELVLTHDALLLDRHGSLTLGDTLDKAMMRLEWIEQAAKIMLAVTPILGQLPTDLPAERVEEIYALRGK